MPRGSQGFEGTREHDLLFEGSLGYFLINLGRGETGISTIKGNFDKNGLGNYGIYLQGLEKEKSQIFKKSRKQDLETII